MQNHTVERLWVEVNARVNYPIMAALIVMTERGEISADDPLCQSCVSWFTINVANVGVTLFVNAWNNHPIPGGLLVMYWHNLQLELYTCPKVWMARVITTERHTSVYNNRPPAHLCDGNNKQFASYLDMTTKLDTSLHACVSTTTLQGGGMDTLLKSLISG